MAFANRSGLTSIVPDARLAIVALVLLFVTAVLAAQANIALGGYARALIAGDPVTQEQAHAIDRRQALLATILLGAFVLALFAFLRWFHLSHRNLVRAAVSPLRYHTAWTVVGFGVPVMNLWRPYQMMAETVRGSEAWMSSVGSSRFTPWSRVAVVGAWWVLVLAAVAARVFVVQMRFSPEAEGAVRASLYGLGVETATALAALASIFVVVRVTRLQRGSVQTTVVS